MLLARSDAIVVLPGGLGTLDELSESSNCVSTTPTRNR